MSADAYRYLRDTNILTDLIKNPGGRVKRRIASVGEVNVCTSIIVACELRFGARNESEFVHVSGLVVENWLAC